MTLYAANLVSLAVVVIKSVDRVKSVVLMVVVRFQDRVHVVQTLTVQVGINAVVIIVVHQVKGVVLMVRAVIIVQMVHVVNVV
jgi:hypothetical protein